MSEMDRKGFLGTLLGGIAALGISKPEEAAAEVIDAAEAAEMAEALQGVADASQEVGKSFEKFEGFVEAVGESMADLKEDSLKVYLTDTYGDFPIERTTLRLLPEDGTILEVPLSSVSIQSQQRPADLRWDPSYRNFLSARPVTSTLEAEVLCQDDQAERFILPRVGEEMGIIVRANDGVGPVQVYEGRARLEEARVDTGWVSYPSLQLSFRFIGELVLSHE